MKRKDKVLKYVSRGTSIERICSELKISKSKLKKEVDILKKEGYNIIRQFYYDGNQKYILSKQLPENKTMILGLPYTETFRALAASDYHIGSIHENLDYIKNIYEFACKNDIHIILNGGDLIEGWLNPHIHRTRLDQLEYLLENHPYDEHILNFISLGNHDADLLRSIGLDLHQILNEQRDDLISLGYGVNKIGINNVEIAMAHMANDLKGVSADILLTGHGHRFKHKDNIIYIPTASNEIKDNYLPGFIDLNIAIKEGSFHKAVFKHYVLINNKIHLAGDGIIESPKIKKLT